MVTFQKSLLSNYLWPILPGEKKSSVGGREDNFKTFISDTNSTFLSILHYNPRNSEDLSKGNTQNL